MTKLYARRGFEWAEDGLAGLWCPVLTGATQGMLLDCNPSTSNHGTLTGYTDLNAGWLGSEFGTVVRLNGNGNRVRLGAASVTGLSVFTVMYWGRRLASLRALGVIQGNSETNRVFFAKGDDDRWYCGGRFPSGDLFANSTTTDVLDVNRWIHFVAVVRTGVPASSGFRVWVNATAIPMSIYGTGNVPTMPTYTTGLDLSERFTGANTGYHFGDIAEVVLLPFEVSLNQIQQHYQAGPGGAWQDRPRRSRSYFAQVLLTYRNRSSRHLCYPG